MLKLMVLRFCSEIYKAVLGSENLHALGQPELVWNARGKHETITSAAFNGCVLNVVHRPACHARHARHTCKPQVASTVGVMVVVSQECSGSRSRVAVAVVAVVVVVVAEW